MSSKERVASLRKRVAKDPYDAAAWEELVSEADRTRRGSERNAAMTAVYEDLLSKFPTAAGYWREYADHQMSCAGEAVVKSVFSRCLLTCLSVDLWRSYLNFIKRLNEPRGAEGLPEIRQAYEFTLDRLGQDSSCGGLWLDYIAFLQAPRLGSPEYAAVFGEALEGQEESGKAAALRRAYQRALVVPTPQLEGLWRGYEGFEMGGSNKQLARRLLDEWRPRYQAARGLLREREARLSSLNLKAMALPPGRGGYTQQQQAAAWREYLEWERSNPQHLDQPTYVARVSLAFEQALMVLFHCPDVWLEFARWHQQGGGGGPAAALAVVEKGRGALPAALVLHFAAADLHESLGNVAAAKAIYEELVEGLKAPEAAGAAGAAAPASAAAKPAEAAAAAAAAAGAAAQVAAAAPSAEPAAAPAAAVEGGQLDAAQPARGYAAAPAAEQPQPQPADNAADGATGAAAGEQQQVAADVEGAAQVPPPPPPPPPAVEPEVKQEEAAAVKQDPGAAAAAGAVKQEPGEQAPAAAQAQDGQAAAAQQGGGQVSQEGGTLAWIQYMRFTRRVEGIMAARKVFFRARKWPGLLWQAYAASASMEWRHEAKETIPRNVFELGLKSHLAEPGLVLAYVQFLLGLGDIANTRALFERALTATPPEAAAPLWDAYVELEYDVGSLAAAAAVEQRRQEAQAALQEAAAAAAAGAALDGKQPAAPPPKPEHEALRLALMKYRVMGLWPASDVQRLHFERLLGQAPAVEGGESRAREHDSGSRRDREKERDRERGEREPRRHGDRAASPPRRGSTGGGSGSHAPRSPPRDAEPLRLSRELAQLMSQLPPPHKLEGPVPDVERVVQVILAADLTPDGIINHEIAAARERRRQRRIAETGGVGGPPGGGGPPAPAGGGASYGSAPGGGGGLAGQKRKAALADYDSGSESDYEGDHHHHQQQHHYDAAAAGAPAAPPGGAGPGLDAGGYSGPPGGGMDIYRMRRKQQRG